MNSVQHLELQESKLQLQLQLKIQNFIDDYIMEFIHVLDCFKERQLPYRVMSIDKIPSQWRWPLREFFMSSRLKDYQFYYAILMDNNRLMDICFSKYPSLNPIKYIPDFHDYIPKEKRCNRTILERLISQKELENQKIFLYFIKYSILLEANLFDILKLDSEEVFNVIDGDVLIFPEKQEWLLSYSSNEEWYFV
ncbi:hypothetical protein [Soonwooa sp.]|uniref:hypothetical protein n=1 Tax=Soonwooa sp. TaxID=1938592 RepID=UPI0035B26098